MKKLLSLVVLLSLLITNLNGGYLGKKVKKGIINKFIS